MVSNLTVFRAVNSEHGERLTEIAIEHVKLANLAISFRNRGDIDIKIIDERIAALRDERDSILDLYKGDEEDAR